MTPFEGYKLMVPYKFERREPLPIYYSEEHDNSKTYPQRLQSGDVVFFVEGYQLPYCYRAKIICATREIIGYLYIFVPNQFTEVIDNDL